MSRYNHHWIKFLSGYNVIKVTNEKEFDVFKNFLSKCGLLYVLNNDLAFEYWQHLAEINNKNPNIFLFEYHNEKGITWWDNIKDAEDYYGEKPIEVTQLDEFFDAVNKEESKEKIKGTENKKLCDLLEIEENNMECVVFKVKENSKLNLIKLGCFEGNETMIRVSKGADNTFTIFTDKTHYSWEHGKSGYTLVSDNMDKKRLMILDCIELDFGIYIGENKEKIVETLDIQTIEDTYKKNYDIKIMYWKNSKDTDVTVHKNGAFFRHFSGLETAKNTLAKYNYELTFKDTYIAETGCIVEEYSMKRIDKSQQKNNEYAIENENENDYDYN